MVKTTNRYKARAPTKVGNLTTRKGVGGPSQMGNRPIPPRRVCARLLHA